MISNIGHTPVSRQKAIWLLDVDFSACESCRVSIFSHTATNYCELQSSKDKEAADHLIFVGSQILAEIPRPDSLRNEEFRSRLSS